MPSWMYERVVHVADQNGISIAEIGRRALKAFLRQDPGSMGMGKSLVRTSFMIPHRMKKNLICTAESANVTEPELVRRALARYLGRWN